MLIVSLLFKLNIPGVQKGWSEKIIELVVPLQASYCQNIYCVFILLTVLRYMYCATLSQYYRVYRNLCSQLLFSGWATQNSKSPLAASIIAIPIPFCVKCGKLHYLGGEGVYLPRKTWCLRYVTFWKTSVQESWALRIPARLEFLTAVWLKIHVSWHVKLYQLANRSYRRFEGLSTV